MNWIVVGASTIASQYMIDAIRAQAAGEVIWVVSGSQERASDFAREHGIANATTDLEQALSDPSIEAVYVCSTNEKHQSQTMSAIAAGKHVLCEKPLATSVADAIQMIDAAKNAGITLATNHHLRCSGSHRAIRALVKDGKIGRVLSMRIFHAVHLPDHLRGWRLDNPDAGGGVILDITVHDADVARFILGEDPQEITAQMGVSGMGQGVEDSAMSVWKMPSGAMVMSHESFTHPFAGSGLEIHGTEGSIFATDVMTQDPLGRIELVTQAGRRVVPFSDHNLYGQSVLQFGEAIQGKGEAAATGIDGVKSLIIASAVHKSAALGTRQHINYGEIE